MKAHIFYGIGNERPVSVSAYHDGDALEPVGVGEEKQPLMPECVQESGRIPRRLRWCFSWLRAEPPDFQGAEIEAEDGRRQCRNSTCCKALT